MEGRGRVSAEGVGAERRGMEFERGGIGQKLTAPPQLREIKHCATVFHPGASAKRKAALRRGHARAASRLAVARCSTKMLRVYIWLG